MPWTNFHSRSRVFAAALALALVACDRAGPERFVPVARQRVEAGNGVVAASHPLAAEAGVAMLRGGGNAVDAVVAAAFAVGVLEPMMAGVGGGGALTLWLADGRRAEHAEFYASAGADPDWALDSLLETVPLDSVPPERLAAVPGAVAGLLEAHERYGRLARDSVLAPAIRLAREGFPVHPLLARVIEEEREKLRRDSVAAAIFIPGGEPLRAGDWLVQPELAATLERVAREGRDAFYRGPMAQTLVARLSAGGNPITLDDLARFRPRWRRPLCGRYREYTILTAPPPLAGVEVLEALNLLETRPLRSIGLPAEAAEPLGLIVDAIRIARADGDAWIGSPNDAGVPAVGLASETFAAERGPLLRAPVSDTLVAGDPWDEERTATLPGCAALDPFPATQFSRPAPDSGEVPRPGAGAGRRGGSAPPGRTRRAAAADQTETTHLSVIDRQGNAASLTYTLGLYFGSGVLVGGAFLNTAAANFGGPDANRRGPDRTPRSSTAPTLVLSGEEVRLAVGSPGSGRIPPAIVHVILYTLEYGLDPWVAVAMPRIYPSHESAEVQVEGGFAPEALAALRARGYELRARPPFDLYFGGVHAVLRRGERLIGAADPRRDGAVAGY